MKITNRIRWKNTVNAYKSIKCLWHFDKECEICGGVEKQPGKIIYKKPFPRPQGNNGRVPSEIDIALLCFMSLKAVYAF